MTIVKAIGFHKVHDVSFPVYVHSSTEMNIRYCFVSYGTSLLSRFLTLRNSFV